MSENESTSRSERNDDVLSWTKSINHLFFRTHFTILLLFVPLSFTARWLAWGEALQFSFASLALVPLAMVHICRLLMFTMKKCLAELSQILLHR